MKKLLVFLCAVINDRTGGSHNILSNDTCWRRLLGTKLTRDEPVGYL
jgi:hypothetical protein